MDKSQEKEVTVDDLENSENVNDFFSKRKFGDLPIAGSLKRALHEILKHDFLTKI